MTSRELSITSHFTALLILFEQKSTIVHKSAVVDTNSYRWEGDWLYNSIVAKSVQTYTGKMENGTGIFQKNIVDTIYSIPKSSKRPDINSIFKTLVKDNAAIVDIHSVEKEVKNMVENGLLENRKTCQGLDSFFILGSIQAVFINDNATLRKELNLDFSPKVSPEKQVTFSVETSKVYQ